MPLTIFGQYQVLAASGADTDTRYDFPGAILRIDLSVFDQSLLFQFSPDLTHFTRERELQAGVIASLDMYVRALLVRNKTAGSIGRFNLIGWTDPIEIVGRQFLRQP